MSRAKEGKVPSQTMAYKAELSQRYWEYQEIQFPAWQEFFDRPFAQGTRPPVFRPEEAWRNVIVNPNASQQEMVKLLALSPRSERHRWFGSMNSSQALAQSVLGNLAIYDCLSSLTELHDDEGLELLGKAQAFSDNFAMEFKINYLGERATRCTSLDGHIRGDYQVAIECKFTESEVGRCSRPSLKPCESEHCDGKYERQGARRERCSLTEIGVLYWKYIPQLFRWSSDQDLTPCPLAANYQLVRNVLAVGVSANGQVSSKNGHVVMFYDQRNPAFQEGGKASIAYKDTKQALQEPTMLRKCSWQSITKHLRNEGTLSWLTEQLALKYGL